MKIRHALLIDDNDIDNYISKTIITKSNKANKISTRNSAVEALKYLETLKNNPEEFPDAIFLDIRMPEMDGFGFLDAYTQLPEILNKQCDIYMLTSSNDKGDIERALHYPFVKKYFNKPLEVSMLDSL